MHRGSEMVSQCGTIPGPKSQINQSTAILSPSDVQNSKAGNMRIPNEVILKIAQLCDGWSILKTESLIEIGLPESIAHELTRVYVSDYTSYKSTIYVDGEAVDQLAGVYSLNLLHWLGTYTQIDLQAVTACGRGSQADQYKALIEAALHLPSNESRQPPERVPEV